MKKTEKVIVILNGERIGLINNTVHEIGHYMASVPANQELQFKQTDEQTVFKTQWNQIREFSDPEWLFDRLLPLLEFLAKNNEEIEDIALQPLKN